MQLCGDANCLEVQPLTLPLAAPWVQPPHTLWHSQPKHTVLGAGRDGIVILEVDFLHSVESFRRWIPLLPAVSHVSYILSLPLLFFLWLLSFCNKALNFLMTDQKCCLSCGVQGHGAGSWASHMVPWSSREWDTMKALLQWRNVKLGHTKGVTGCEFQHGRKLKWRSLVTAIPKHFYLPVKVDGVWAW